MDHHGRRLGGLSPWFDPLLSEVIREPDGSGPGHWVGAPGVYHDADSGRWYLTYRVRQPRPVRGGITRLAVSDNGVVFEDIFECRKEDLDSQSIERCAILKGLDGRWRWYVSYVDPASSQWRVDVVTADSPAALDPANRVKVFESSDIPGLEGVKDPYLFLIGRLYYLVTSVGEQVEAAAEREADKHATGDIFNTGLTRSSTGLACGADGLSFRWLGLCGADRSGWDAYCFRINSVLYTPPVFTAFYDGSASVEENYEERCGVAQSLNLTDWQRVSDNGPAITVPHGSGSVRYVDAVTVGGRTWCYFEAVRPDGSHELRVAVSSAG